MKAFAGVRYQLWHALAVFAAVLVTFLAPTRGGWFGYAPLRAFDTGYAPLALAAGWLFVAGVVLFSGSLHVLSLSGKRSWGVVAPLGACVSCWAGRCCCSRSS